MNKHAQPCAPRIVFEQPYGAHSPAVAKLLNEAAEVREKNREDALNDRSVDLTE
tara:strand:+ start:9698 stop:9859 length:162 start_codon:yes stop_codon:yes gene_type:complete